MTEPKKPAAKKTAAPKKPTASKPAVKKAATAAKKAVATPAPEKTPEKKTGLAKLKAWLGY